VATRRSAGILLHRTRSGHLEVLLGHMGGPFWARRDAGAWTIPKGEHADDEPALDAARREFVEELGLPVPDGETIDLGEVRQRGGKLVRAFALAGDLDPDAVVPGTFELEWPPRSGRAQVFPELDRVAWWSLGDARDRIVTGQRPLLERLADAVGTSSTGDG
jgi:predicted NUDIX family NTP pyrophosphohydrolase